MKDKTNSEQFKLDQIESSRSCSALPLQQMAVISHLNSVRVECFLELCIIQCIGFYGNLCFFFVFSPPVLGFQEQNRRHCDYCVWLVTAAVKAGWGPVKFSQSPPMEWIFPLRIYCSWEQNEKWSKGDDEEAGSHSMLSPIPSYRWDAVRGGALGSLNDFLPRPIQWKAHDGEVQSLHRTAGPESLWKDCNRAPCMHAHTHIHTPIHSQTYVTHGAQWIQSPAI